MKLKLTGILTIVSVMGFAANANAGAVIDFYAGADMGTGGTTLFTDGEKASDSTMSYGAMVGIDIPVLRVEAEYSHLHHPDLKMDNAMLNAYLKMPSTVIRPYLGIGIGSTIGGDFYGKDLAGKPSYQGMLGVTFDIPAMPIKIDAEARALYVPDFVEFYSVKSDLLNYDFRVKLRYVF